MKRLFIELDGKTKEDQTHLKTLSELGRDMFGMEESNKLLFDTVIWDAASNSDKTWKAVKEHDQLFIQSSLIPRHGGSFGSGMLMNGLMYKAIEENVEGKSLYFFNNYKDIWWDELKKDLVDKCFRKNFLYTKDEDFEKWIQVDIDKLLKEEL